MTTKALLERERAECKLKMARIYSLATTPRRAAIMTHDNLIALLAEIEKIASEPPQ